jgi:hypothetical protein
MSVCFSECFWCCGASGVPTMWRGAMIDSFLMVFTLECASSLAVHFSLHRALWHFHHYTQKRHRARCMRCLRVSVCAFTYYRTIRACNDKEIRCIIAVWIISYVRRRPNPPSGKQSSHALPICIFVPMRLQMSLLYGPVCWWCTRVVGESRRKMLCEQVMWPNVLRKLSNCMRSVLTVFWLIWIGNYTCKWDESDRSTLCGLSDDWYNDAALSTK